ncbi:MAG: acetylornithine aminotransferase [Glaciihabitans sp.]|nr:acetylornithine aminotransferase [Glaciihabitans sp.]
MTGTDAQPNGSTTPVASPPAWTDRYRTAIMGSAALPQAMLERGEGAYVWDTDGKKYLDFLAGIAVNSLGHAHPVLVEAISRQAAALIHVSNYFATEPQLELAERLRTITGAGDRGRVYFGNSGAEAIEAALKLSRLNKGRRTVVSLNNSFHGRTMGALSLTGKTALREPFEPLVPGVVHIDTTFQALEASINDTVAALIIEPIKGEAGVVDLPEGFLKRARELTTEHGVLLILDEIQTGVGRTGSWFAFQRDGIVPDALAVAKGIAGGVPIGALITFGDTSDLFEAGQHGSTFGGNPLATAAANAVLGEIERADLINNAIRRGEQLRAAILGINSPLVVEIRGAGLLLGIGLAQPVAAQVSRAALELGLIINAPNDSSIRIAPPLIIGDAEIAQFTTTFARALEATA